jgi:uncharacterized protein
MKILLTGTSGFIGSYLARFFLNHNHHVVGVARSQAKKALSHPNFTFVAADTTVSGSWVESIAGMDAVINLAGRSIFGRWNPTAKAEIRESRILTTRHVVQGLASGKPTVLISASGIGYYGNRGDEVLTEETSSGNDFLALISADWEKEALAATAKGARVALTRFGVVLGKDGGALPQMLPAFKSFLGGPIGNGRQWFPWVHIEDLAAAILFLIERPEIKGPVNICAPEPIRNHEFAAALGRTLKRPAVLPAPAFMIRLILGEFADVLLGSQRAIPQELLRHHFKFRHANIQSALGDLLPAETA